MKELAEILPLNLVLELVTKLGGQNIYISGKSLKPSKIMDIVGAKNMQLLCNQYPGQIICIPNLKNLKIKIRNQHILLERSKGLAIKKLALKFKLTERQIYNILNKGDHYE